MPQRCWAGSCRGRGRGAGKGEGCREGGRTVTQLGPAGPFCRSSRGGKEEVIPVTFYKHQRGSVKVFSIQLKNSCFVLSMVICNRERPKGRLRGARRGGLQGHRKLNLLTGSKPPGGETQHLPCGCVWPIASQLLHEGEMDPALSPSDGAWRLEQGLGEEAHRGPRATETPTLLPRVVALHVHLMQRMGLLLGLSVPLGRPAEGPRREQAGRGMAGRGGVAWVQGLGRKMHF